jgi:DNA-binding transcriptional LysR family regulator
MDQLRAMRTFVQVVDAGSFAAASRALNVAPAATTRTIAELENHLGARLLTRTTRRLALTEIGARYLERARAIVADVDDAAALASAAQTHAQGRVRLRAPGAFAANELGPRLQGFHAAHPRISLLITAHDASEALDETHDLTIVARRDAPDGDFVAHRLATSERVLCATPGYLRRAGRPRHGDDLARHALLLPAQQRTLALTQRASGERVAVATPAPTLESASEELLRAGALAGIGIALLPSYIAAPALKDATLERVLADWRLHEQTIWACMPSRRHVPAATRALLDFLRGEYHGRDGDPWLAPPAAVLRPAFSAELRAA